MWSAIFLVTVMTFHLHACHNHTHSIHVANADEGQGNGSDIAKEKLTRIKTQSGQDPGRTPFSEETDSGSGRLSSHRNNTNIRPHNRLHESNIRNTDPDIIDADAVCVICDLAVKELFEKYGNAESIDFNGFQQLMTSIGLGNTSLDDRDQLYDPEYSQQQHDSVGHDGSDGQIEPHDYNMSHDHHKERLIRGTGAQFTKLEPDEPGKQERNLRQQPRSNNERMSKKKKKERKSKKNEHKEKKSRTENDNVLPEDYTSPSSSPGNAVIRKRSLSNDLPSLDKCLTPEDVMSMFTKGSAEVGNFSLSEANFVQLCPILINQLDRRSCPTDHALLYKSSKLQQLSHDDMDDPHDHNSHHRHETDESASENMTIASSAEFTDSAKVWGYAFLSCLIISVVGLASVAIVPIMHKVIYNHLLQFLVALAIGSLTGDAFLHLLPHAMIPHDQQAHDHDAAADLESLEKHKEQDRMAIWVGCVALAGIYFFLLAERIMGIITKKRREKNRKKRKMRASPTRPYNEEQETHIGAKLSSHNDEMKSCEETLMVVHPNKGVCSMAVEAHDEVHQNCDPDVRNTWGPGQSHDSAGPGHHHSHEVPGSVASVAWMVIVGDGLHNFSDGLAIGAAFANGLTSGLSTSIAVFCHELPHELGDFAVLLRAGMSVKQALVYNCVSSILCLFGMITGIAVGNLEAASQWIFALISGMFIYIALVDMLPEISNISPKEGENPGIHLLLQSAGIVTGAAIMLLIAIYEDRIHVPHWEP